MPYRSKSKASIKPEEIIPESPTELLDERELPSRSLAVDEESRAAINSPPPRPSSGPNQKKDIQIPVPTPSPTQLNKGKEEHESSKFSIENENSSTERQEFEISKSSVENEGDVQLKKSVEFGNLKSSVENKYFSEENQEQDGSYFVEHLTDTSQYFNDHSGKKHDNSVEDNADERDTDYKVNNINEDDEKYSESSEILPQKDNFESLQLSFENIHSKIGREDVIVDPIKLLEGEGESLKNAEENGRDHYDEGFHSGELVNSEEDSNSIETVGSSETKDEDALKPARAATPMPRSNSFYKSAKGDSESKRIKKSMVHSLKTIENLPFFYVTIFKLACEYFLSITVVILIIILGCMKICCM